MTQRRTTRERQTRETRIKVSVDLDGRGDAKIATGLGFFDHMLELLARHSGIDLEVEASGDLRVDEHHLIEDVGIALGQALGEASGDKSGLERYGWAMIPMDEVLVAVAIDLGGRFAFACDYAPERPMVGAFPTEMAPHFFRSLAVEMRANAHIRFLTPGANEHHRLEAMFKGFARALRMAVARDPKMKGAIPSTKGVL
jgi:imidazoleglycerol phosphate dehydratase HisB